MRIDELDRQIIFALKANARTPFLSLARKLGCSEGTIRKRVKRLEKNAVIRKFTLQLDTQIEFETVVCIKCEPKETKGVVEKLRKMKTEASSVMEVTGAFDIICICQAENAKAMNILIDKIRDFRGVLDTQSFTIIEKS
ncbi:MAG: Lrp/AsnC family transcriptional regulator [Candidatus Diapherotrites archaeon]|nr:Lrp/AsnC family transcriptional regulator [Candidatus Diapherotrites archaeon]